MVRMLIDRRVDGVIAAAPAARGGPRGGRDAPAVRARGQPAPRAGRRGPAGRVEPPGGRPVATEHLIRLGPHHDRDGHRAVPPPGGAQQAARLRGRAARGRDRAGRGPGRGGGLDAGHRGRRHPAAAGARPADDRDLRAQRHDGHRRAVRAGRGRPPGPADVAVVSCDDMPFAEYLTPSLSSLRVPFAETGREAVELLLRSIAGEPAPESAGAAAGRADRPRLLRRPGRQRQPARRHLTRRQPGAPREAEGGFVTRIVVDPARQLGSVDRNVFGGFVEHLGRCIYGGLYDEGSPLADARGFRTDVLGLLRELRHGRAALAGRQLRQQLPLGRRHRAEGRAAAPARAGLGRRGVQPVRHRRVHGLLRRSSAPSPTSA